MRALSTMTLALCVLSSPALAQVSQPTPNFAGTWQMIRRAPAPPDASHDAHAAHDTAAAHQHERALPPAAERRILITITHNEDSITVDRKMVDTAGKPVLWAGKVTYRPAKEWTGPYNSPPESTARTSMQWLEGGQVLELTTDAVFMRTGNERHIITIESWRMDAAGTAIRHWREMGTNARGEATLRDVIEIYKRQQ